MGYLRNVQPMKNKNYRTSIPTGAIEVVEKHFEGGAKDSAFFFLGGEKVGFRMWNENGVLEFEYGIKNGLKHGREYCFQDGRPYEVTPYRNGTIHGVGKQWWADGELQITYKLINGTGVDLWCDDKGALSEEHYYPKHAELGYYRDWTGDDKTICEEYYFFPGKGYHGVWRRWNKSGRMRRGFPQFYVNDKRVTKRHYQDACTNDDDLPTCRPEEDEPYRALPPEYTAQRKRSKGKAHTN
jgi:antitoxin component YwqK of YwqJK toxin-antitoxin module